MKNEEQARSLFGISLSGRPRWQQFLMCCSGFFLGTLLMVSVSLEFSTKTYLIMPLSVLASWPKSFFYLDFGVKFCFLLLISGVCLQQTPIQLWMVLHLCARLGLHFVDLSARIHPWKTYVKLSAVLMGSNGLTKGSLAFLNYPAQIMFKSTKVIPVMIMGSFIPGLRRKYPPREYLSAVLLVVGLILFTLADAQTSPNFSVIGVLMVSGALIMDSFLGNLQEAIFTMNPETTQTEMLFCSTLVGMPFLIPPMLVTGELFKAWTSCSENLYVYGVLVFEAMATFIGQVSVLSLIALFGAATTAMITTARKAVTLLLSYMIFTKPLTEQHGSGLLLIAMGIVLKMLPDYKPSEERATSNSHAKIENTRPREDVAFQTGIQEDEEKRPLV